MEHKKQDVANLHVFFARLVSYGLFATLLILLSITMGVLGYHFIANLRWIDSFHMTCMILTGMGPVSNMETNNAKLFSSFFALYSGVAFLSITAVFFAPVIHRILHILHVESDDSTSA